MATVKGDVHDIGKNIVGVVLQCNNYEVIDLGVMVPATKILETAKRENADIIGLSGLITPSLDEMCHVAAEMEREGFALPLLIGGATTSRVHTAVKIHPNYRRGQTVYVTDASRAVGVVSQLMSQQVRGAYVSEVREEYAKIAAAHARGEENKRRLSLKDARKNALALDWSNYVPPQPSFLGTRVFEDYPFAELIDYIDWSPFFSTWELTGKFPAILDDEKFGEAGALALRRTRARCSTRSSTRTGSGRRPSSASGRRIRRGDDIIVGRRHAGRAAHPAPAACAARGPRQLWRSRTSSRRRSPAGRITSAHSSVTAGIGEGRASRTASSTRTTTIPRSWSRRWPIASPKPFAERMHQRVRKEFWGYAATRRSRPRADRGESIAASVRRPAIRRSRTTPRRRRCSADRGERVGVKLTESFAMWPGASVCGLYFSHPDAHYFGVGKIERDQVEDYAARKGWSVQEAERWLAPVLNYDPLASRARRRSKLRHARLASGRPEGLIREPPSPSVARVRCAMDPALASLGRDDSRRSIRQRVHVFRDRRKPVRDRRKRVALHLVGRKRRAAERIGERARRGRACDDGRLEAEIDRSARGRLHAHVRHETDQHHVRLLQRGEPAREVRGSESVRQVLCTTASPGAGVAGEATSKPACPGRMRRRPCPDARCGSPACCSARARAEQLADLGERRLDIRERQLAVDIFALRVDHHDGRFGQRRRRGICTGHFEQRFRLHGDSFCGRMILSENRYATFRDHAPAQNDEHRKGIPSRCPP
jgi:hypothetical protein